MSRLLWGRDERKTTDLGTYLPRPFGRARAREYSLGRPTYRRTRRIASFVDDDDDDIMKGAN